MIAEAAPATLVRTPGTALHRQLFMVLREQITRGIYQPQAMLPREEDLCAYFGVSRITVRRALSDLQQEGLVERHAGRGTFVSAKLPARLSPASVNFLEAMKRSGKESSVKVLALETTQPPGLVALQMQMASNAQAVYCSRLRHVGERNLLVTEAWIPLELGKRITATQLKKQPLFDILLAQGLKFGRVIEEITAVSAPPHLAGLLNTGVGMPLLRVTRLLYGANDKPVEHLTIHLNPERSRVLLNVPPQELRHSTPSRIVHDVGT